MSDEVDFLHGVRHENFLKIDSMIFDGDGQTFPKFLSFPASWYQHFDIVINDGHDCQILKVTSLQYLKKEVRDGVHFLQADKHQSFYKLALLFLMEKARHVQSTQNRKLVIFLQYLKKKSVATVLCSIVIKKHSDIFTGVQSCLLLIVVSCVEFPNWHIKTC